LKEEEIMNDAEMKKVDDEVREEVEHAVRFAEESPLPAPEELFTNVYADQIPEDK
jgi:pyruvate dehydrogenase E1 component alpha subunit